MSTRTVHALLIVLGSLSTSASQSRDVAHMVNVKVEAKQRVAIAERVAGRWEELASYLAPALFTYNQVLVIRKDNPYSQFLQAKAMLDVWSDQFDSQATCGVMIKALLAIGCKAEAAIVFSHELVEFVGQQRRETEV